MCPEDPLLDEFDVEQLQRALHRRRPDLQILSRPDGSQPAVPSLEMPISPAATGFSTTVNWQDASGGVVSESGAPPSTDMDADLAFWASLAGWDDSELDLPQIEPGMSQQVSLRETGLSPGLKHPWRELGPSYHRTPNPNPVMERALDVHDLRMPTDVVHEL